MTMLEDDIWTRRNISIAFFAMDRHELFKTWRNLTDTLGGDFPVVYSKPEFDELIERMPEEELAKLVEKSAYFYENHFYFSIYNGQLYSTNDLDNIVFIPIRETCDKAYDMLVEKKLTLGSKRLEEAFTEDFNEDMKPMFEDLLCFFENELDEWEKCVEGCKEVGYDGKNGPFPMEESDILKDYWVETDSCLDEDGNVSHDGYYTDEVSDRFNFQDDWFYWSETAGQFRSFTDWDCSIGDEIGLSRYLYPLHFHIIETGDDLGIAKIREILDKNKKYGYTPHKDWERRY